MIGAIGEWVVREACAEAVKWPKHLHVAVNLSQAEVELPQLVATITSALAASGLDPERLELDLTEPTLLADNHEVRATLAGLKALGVRLALGRLVGLRDDVQRILGARLGPHAAGSEGAEAGEELPAGDVPHERGHGVQVEILHGSTIPGAGLTTGPAGCTRCGARACASRLPEPRLVFFVREDFPSRSTGTRSRRGRPGRTKAAR